jgi:hypothetical protein
VRLCPAGDQIAPGTNRLAIQFEAPFQPVQIDSAGAIKIDGRVSRPLVLCHAVKYSRLERLARAGATVLSR